MIATNETWGESGKFDVVLGSNVLRKGLDLSGEAPVVGGNHFLDACHQKVDNFDF